MAGFHSSRVAVTERAREKLGYAVNRLHKVHERRAYFEIDAGLVYGQGMAAVGRTGLFSANYFALADFSIIEIMMIEEHLVWYLGFDDDIVAVINDAVDTDCATAAAITTKRAETDYWHSTDVANGQQQHCS